MATIRRLLFIVGSRRPGFYESLRRTFRGDDTVQVVLDRRRGERRKNRRAGRRKDVREQRVSERRDRREIDRQIRARGYAVVGITAARPSPRRPREAAQS